MKTATLFLSELETLKQNPHYTKGIESLNLREMGLLLSFITENSTLCREEFEMKINRFFLDSPEKPARLSIIQEILAALNSKINPAPERADAHSIEGLLLPNGDAVILQISGHLFTTSGGIKGYRGKEENTFYLKGTDGFILKEKTEKRIREIAQGYDN